MATTTYKLAIGQLVATPGALDVLTYEDVLTLVERHRGGDWGDVCPEDWRANDDALLDSGRILSAYTVRNQRIWIITEADRSLTTILLPEEY